jgi:hypothetical protein
MLSKAILALALFSTAAAAPAPKMQNGWIIDGPVDVDAQWEQFKLKYHKMYSATEEVVRKAKFEVSLARAQERNAVNIGAGGKAIFGVTKFSDHSQEEFDSLYKGRKGHGMLPAGYESKNAAPPAAAATPTFVDWTAAGYTTPVKNQGQCGSCWANSATEQIESQYMLAGFPMWELSVQQVTSCTAGTFGCGGGDTTGAYAQIISDADKFGEATSGVASAAMVPYVQSMYEGCSGPLCTEQCSDAGVGNLTVMASYEAFTGPFVSITDYSYATPACTGACATQDLATLNANIAAVGPASVCVNAGCWNDYVGGVMTTAACGGYAYGDLDHCVQLTGFNLTAAEPYYMVRNSWATNWGNSGYIYLSAAGNTCGLADEATFVTINPNTSI